MELVSIARPRDRPLDAFRGVAIVAMVAANFLADKAVVPAWLKHAPDIGLTVIDVIAPMFVVAMASSFAESYRRRAERSGKAAARWEMARRAFALIGLGAILSAGQSYALPESGAVDWGVLQALGVAYFALLATAELSILARALIGLGLLAAYQLILPATVPFVLARSHGGMLGAVSWSAMALVGEAIVSRTRRNGPGLLGSSGIVTAGAGWALSLIAPISKNRVSASYVLVCLGLSCLFLACLRLAYRRAPNRPGFLEIWGRRPLALYLAHQIALAVFVLVPSDRWHSASPPWLVLAQLAGLLAGLSLLAWLLERRRLDFRI